jgi:hypothetical protein
MRPFHCLSIRGKDIAQRYIVDPSITVASWRAGEGVTVKLATNDDKLLGISLEDALGDTMVGTVDELGRLIGIVPAIHVDRRSTR